MLLKKNTVNTRETGFRFFLINDRKNRVNELFFSKRLVYTLVTGVSALVMGSGAMLFSAFSEAQYDLKVQSRC